MAEDTDEGGVAVLDMPEDPVTPARARSPRRNPTRNGINNRLTKAFESAAVKLPELGEPKLFQTEQGRLFIAADVDYSPENARQLKSAGFEIKPRFQRAGEGESAQRRIAIDLSNSKNATLYSDLTQGRNTVRLERIKLQAGFVLQERLSHNQKEVSDAQEALRTHRQQLREKPALRQEIKDYKKFLKIAKDHNQSPDQLPAISKYQEAKAYLTERERLTRNKAEAESVMHKMRQDAHNIYNPEALLKSLPELTKPGVMRETNERAGRVSVRSEYSPENLRQFQEAGFIPSIAENKTTGSRQIDIDLSNERNARIYDLITGGENRKMLGDLKLKGDQYSKNREATLALEEVNQSKKAVAELRNRQIEHKNTLNKNPALRKQIEAYQSELDFLGISETDKGSASGQKYQTAIDYLDTEKTLKSEMVDAQEKLATKQDAHKAARLRADPDYSPIKAFAKSAAGTAHNAGMKVVDGVVSKTEPVRNLVRKGIEFEPGPGSNKAAGAAGLGMSLHGMYNAVQRGDIGQMVVSGADMVVSTGDMALDFVDDVSRAGALKGLAVKANYVVMAADGIYQISQEDSLAHGLQRGTAVAIAAGASMYAASLGTAGAAAAIASIGVGGIGAAALTVGAPIVAAMAAGYGAAVISEATIETLRIYEQEAQRFNANFDNLPHGKAIKYRLGTDLVDELKNLEGSELKDNELTLKDGTKLQLAMDGGILNADDIDLSNPENMGALQRALDKKIASTQVHFDKTDTSAWWGETLDEHNDAASDLKILQSAKEEINSPQFKEYMAEKTAHMQKLKANIEAQITNDTKAANDLGNTQGNIAQLEDMTLAQGEGGPLIAAIKNDEYDSEPEYASVWKNKQGEVSLFSSEQLREMLANLPENLPPLMQGLVNVVNTVLDALDKVASGEKKADLTLDDDDDYSSKIATHQASEQPPPDPEPKTTINAPTSTASPFDY